MQDWHRVLTPALCAPSPHNTQPWRVRIVDERRAVLYMDVRRTLPDEDRTGHFLVCAMGIFLEAVGIAAGHAGRALRFELVERDGGHPLKKFAEMELVEGDGEAGEFSEELLRRRVTSRLPSDGRRMEAAVAERLRQFERRWGQRYHQIDDAGMIEAIVWENIRAVFHDLNDRRYHDEIVRWFRYTDAEAREKRDGLDHRCMRTAPLELRMMRSLPGVMKWGMTRGVIGRRYRRQLGAVMHLGVISGAFFDDRAAVDAGRFLLRFWLEAARHGLVVHPFGNLVTNGEAHAMVKATTGIADPWLVFRIGYTAEPPRSYRRELQEVLIHD